MLTLTVSGSFPLPSLTLTVGGSFTPSLEVMKRIPHRHFRRPMFQVTVDSVARIRVHYVTEVRIRAQCFWGSVLLKAECCLVPVLF